MCPTWVQSPGKHCHHCWGALLVLLPLQSGHSDFAASLWGSSSLSACLSGGSTTNWAAHHQWSLWENQTESIDQWVPQTVGQAPLGGHRAARWRGTFSPDSESGAGKNMFDWFRGSTSVLKHLDRSSAPSLNLIWKIMLRSKYLLTGPEHKCKEFKSLTWLLTRKVRRTGAVLSCSNSFGKHLSLKGIQKRWRVTDHSCTLGFG